MFPACVYEALGRDGVECQSSYNTLGDFIMYALKCVMTNWERVLAALGGEVGGVSFPSLFFERISFCVSAQKSANSSAPVPPGYAPH